MDGSRARSPCSNPTRLRRPPDSTPLVQELIRLRGIDKSLGLTSSNTLSSTLSAVEAGVGQGARQGAHAASGHGFNFSGGATPTAAGCSTRCSTACHDAYRKQKITTRCPKQLLHLMPEIVPERVLPRIDLSLAKLAPDLFLLALLGVAVAGIARHDRLQAVLEELTVTVLLEDDEPLLLPERPRRNTPVSRRRRSSAARSSLSVPIALLPSVRTFSAAAARGRNQGRRRATHGWQAHPRIERRLGLPSVGALAIRGTHRRRSPRPT